LFDSPSTASSVVSPNASIRVPERKKRRRNPDAKTRQQAVGKKRKARNEESVIMDIDDLAGKSSAEIDAYITSLSSQGPLKAEDERRLTQAKRAKRQAKNRESAQISRIRHRDHVDLVEAQLEYQKMVAEKWREYALKLKKALEEHEIELPPPPVIPEFVPPTPSDLSIFEPARAIMRPLRTAGFCLVLFVISLGVVFNLMHHSSAESSDNKNSLVPVSAPTAEPSARVMADSSASLTQLPSASTAKGDGEPPAPDRIDVIRGSTYLSYDTEKEDSSLALVIPSTKPQAPVAMNAVVPRSGAVMPYTTKTIFGSSKPRLADRSWSLDNTSYILVNDATEFVPRSVDIEHLQPRTQPVIGILVPASSFNIPNLAPGDVVELVCDIRNATLVPQNVLARSLY